MLKRLALPILSLSLTSCAVFDHIFDVKSICDAGQYQVKFVEIATKVVRVKCVNEGQLDVLRQDSTIQILGVAYVRNDDESER